MATSTRIQDEAAALGVLCKRVAEMLDDVNAFLAHNSAQAIDWGGVPTPVSIPVGDDGQISGVQFTPAQAANAIGTLSTLAGSVTVANGHRGNLDIVRNP